MSNTDTSASARLRQIKAHTLSVYRQNNPHAHEGGSAKTADASVITSLAPGLFPITSQGESKSRDETCIDCVRVTTMAILVSIEPIVPVVEPLVPMAMLESMEPMEPLLVSTDTIENMEETNAELELPILEPDSTISTIEQKYLEPIEVQRIPGIPKYVVRYPILQTDQSNPRRFISNYRLITRGVLVQAVS